MSVRSAHMTSQTKTDCFLRPDPPLCYSRQPPPPLPRPPLLAIHPATCLSESRRISHCVTTLHAKAKGRKCLLFKWAVTAFRICAEQQASAEYHLITIPTNCRSLRTRMVFWRWANVSDPGTASKHHWFDVSCSPIPGKDESRKKTVSIHSPTKQPWETLIQCWATVGPASQQWPSIGSRLSH